VHLTTADHNPDEVVVVSSVGGFEAVVESRTPRPLKLANGFEVPQCLSSSVKNSTEKAERVAAYPRGRDNDEA